jgi:hypothetical protein
MELEPMNPETTQSDQRGRTWKWPGRHEGAPVRHIWQEATTAGALLTRTKEVQTTLMKYMTKGKKGKVMPVERKAGSEGRKEIKERTKRGLIEPMSERLFPQQDRDIIHSGT